MHIVPWVILARQSDTATSKELTTVGKAAAETRVGNCAIARRAPDRPVGQQSDRQVRDAQVGFGSCTRGRETRNRVTV